MSEARSGWGGEVWLSSDDNPANYFELVEVVEFDVPDDQADEAEVTHLKSPDKRKEFIRTLLDGGTVAVILNYVPLGATNTRIVAAKEAGDVRAVMFTIPDAAGVPEYKYETFCFVKGHKPGKLTAGGKIDATLTLRITGAQSQGAV